MEMSSTWTIVIIVVAALLFTVWLVSFLLILDRQQAKREGFKALSNGFNSEVEFDESDIKLIYNEKVGKSVLSYVSFLQKYNTHLVVGQWKEIKDPDKVRSLLKSIISQELVSEPYSGLDESDKKAMVTIEKLVTEEKSLSVVQDNLRELSDSIRAYKQEIEKKTRHNKWTYFFGAAGLLLPVISFFLGSRLSNNDRERFDSSFKHIELRIDTLKTSINNLTQELLLPVEEIENKEKH